MDLVFVIVSEEQNERSRRKKGHRKLITKSNEVLLTRSRRQSDQNVETENERGERERERAFKAWRKRVQVVQVWSIANFLVLSRRRVNVATWSNSPSLVPLSSRTIRDESIRKDIWVTNVCSPVATDKIAFLSIALSSVAEIAVRRNTRKFAQRIHAIRYKIHISLSSPRAFFHCYSFMCSLVFFYFIFHRTNFALISRTAIIFPRIQHFSALEKMLHYEQMRERMRVLRGELKDERSFFRSFATAETRASWKSTVTKDLVG